MMTKLLIPFIFLIAKADITNDNVSGIVADKNTKELLAGVRVTSDVDTTYTDLNGRFNIKYDSDTVNLVFYLVSYETDTLELTRIDEDFSIKK